MKKIARSCSLGFLLFLSACASKPQQQPYLQQPVPKKEQEQQKNTDIIGTWQWVLDNGSPVSQPFYVRYHANGKIDSWPSLKDWSDAKGVAHGRYSTTKKFLTIETKSSANSSKSRLEIQDQTMLIITAAGRQLIYRRVTPDITPGKLPDGKPAGFAQKDGEPR